MKNELRALPLSNYDDQLRIATARQLYGDPRFARYANRSLPPIHFAQGEVTRAELNVFIVTYYQHLIRQFQAIKDKPHEL